MLKKMQRNSLSTLRCMATYQSRFGYPMLGGAENYYDVLKVPLNSSGKEIKRAYIELSKKYHPDSNGPTCNPEEFVKVCEAYKILYKRASRDHYNRRMKTQFHMVPPFDTSYTGKNVYKSWETYRSAMRTKQFGRDIPSFSGSTIVHKKPMEIMTRCTIRLPGVGATTQPNPSVFDRITSFEAHFNHNWTLFYYMLGFGLVGLLLGLDNLNNVRQKEAIPAP